MSVANKTNTFNKEKKIQEMPTILAQDYSPAQDKHHTSRLANYLIGLTRDLEMAQKNSAFISGYARAGKT